MQIDDYKTSVFDGMVVLEATEFGLDLRREPFDGFVYSVDSELRYMDSAYISCTRYPAELIEEQSEPAPSIEITTQDANVVEFKSHLGPLELVDAQLVEFSVDGGEFAPARVVDAERGLVELPSFETGEHELVCRVHWKESNVEVLQVDVEASE